MLLYVPNILCYLRIAISLYGITIVQQQQRMTLKDEAFNSSCKLYIMLAMAAMFTDFIDGLSARLLNQCSNIGIFFDVVADNVLRTSLWM